MPRKHTNINDLQEQERQLKARITADLQQLSRIQETMMDESKVLDRQYRHLHDRFAVTGFVSRLRRNTASIRKAIAEISQYVTPSHGLLVAELAAQEETEKRVAERRKVRTKTQETAHAAE